jgi:hypothetical protein
LWEDANGNGVQDPGELGRPGVAVHLVGAGADGLFGTGDDLPVDPVLSGLSGAYSFSGLAAGSYRVSVLVPSGWVLTTGANPVTLSVADGQQVTSADFGLREADASIGGVVFTDADGSGALDHSESGRAGVSVTLKQGGATAATTTTGADGSFRFAALTAGSYVVEVATPPGTVATTLSNSPTVTVAAGEQNGDVRVGFRSAPSVGDEVFLDTNANGSRDAGEPGVANVAVALLSGSTVVASTRSGLAGDYAFTAVAPGNYTVSVTAPPGASITTSASMAVSVGTSSVSTVDFGLAGVGFNPGAVTTVAGNGGTGTVDGVGTAAGFSKMGGVVSAGGAVYVSTMGAIRRFDPLSASVTTLAGSASTTGCVDSPTPSLARFSGNLGDPGDLVTDGTNLFVADVACAKIRKVSLSTGATSTVAATVPNPTRMTLAADGFLYVLSSSNSNVYRVDRMSGTTTVFGALPVPSGYSSVVGGPLTSDADALWVREKASGSTVDSVLVRIGLATATASVLASGGAVDGDLPTTPKCCLSGVLVAAGDFLYGTLGGTDRTVRRWSKADGSFVDVAGTTNWPTTTSPAFSDGVGTGAFLMDGVRGMTFDGIQFWVSDTGNGRLRVLRPAAPLSATFPAAATATVAPDPAVTWTFAGNGTAATVDGFGAAASFASLNAAVAVGRFVYVAEGQAIRKVNQDTGEVTTLVRTAGSWTACTDSDDPAAVKLGRIRSMATDGTYLYVADFDCHSIRRISLQTGATSHIATMDSVANVSYGPDGYLYAAKVDPYQAAVYRVDRITGVTSLFATVPATASVSLGQLAADGQNLWVAVHSTGGPVKLWAVDLVTGVPTQRATLPSSSDTGPLESAGDYLYATGYVASTVRRISKATGAWADIAGPGGYTTGYEDGAGSDARFAQITTIASDGHGLWVGDSGTNLRLRVIEDLHGLLAGGSSYGHDVYAPWDANVNLALGSLVFSDTDANVATVGPPLQVARTYNSADARVGAFGRGWMSNIEMNWTADATGAVTVTYSDGRRAQFTPNGSGGFNPPQGYWATLTPNAGGYILTEKDGSTARFAATGKLTQLADAAGHTVTPSPIAPAGS